MRKEQTDMTAANDSLLPEQDPHASADLGPLMEVSEVERYVHMSRSTIYRRAKEGSFPKPRKIGRLVFWSRADVQRWMALFLAGQPWQEAA